MVGIFSMSRYDLFSKCQVSFNTFSTGEEKPFSNRVMDRVGPEKDIDLAVLKGLRG